VDAPPRTTGGDDPPPDAPPFDPQFDDAGTDAGKDAGGEGGTTCSDPDDAPAGVGTALPATDDCQESNLTVTGIAASAVDEDVYTLSISDKFGCSVEPTFALETSKMKMCVFVQCKTATTDAVSGCSAGTLTTDGQTSLKGCCRTDPGALAPSWNCSGSDDSADLTFRLTPNPGAPACLAYSFKYHF
jgi:hypothetical protein